MSLRSRFDASVVRRRWVVGVLVAATAIVAIEAWFPTTSKVSRDEPVVADGVALFDGRSVLESTPGPEWLGDAIDAGSLEVRLSFETASGDQDGPARLLTITEDVHHADLMIGQDDADLVLRVRRPSSDASGDPAFVVPGAFSEGWHDLSVRIEAGQLEATFDGRVVLDRPLAAGTDGTGVSSWDRNYRVALGDEPDGDREWEGRLRDVAVVTTSGSTDLLAPGVLQPQSGTIEGSRAHDPAASRRIGAHGVAAPDPVRASRDCARVLASATTRRRFSRPDAAAGPGVRKAVCVGAPSGRHRGDRRDDWRLGRHRRGTGHDENEVGPLRRCVLLTVAAGSLVRDRRSSAPPLGDGRTAHTRLSSTWRLERCTNTRRRRQRQLAISHRAVALS